jgi:hypothetical protein
VDGGIREMGERLTSYGVANRANNRVTPRCRAGSTARHSRRPRGICLAFPARHLATPWELCSWERSLIFIVAVCGVWSVYIDV